MFSNVTLRQRIFHLLFQFWLLLFSCFLFCFCLLLLFCVFVCFFTSKVAAVLVNSTHSSFFFCRSFFFFSLLVVLRTKDRLVLSPVQAVIFFLSHLGFASALTWAMPQHVDTKRTTKATLECCYTLHGYTGTAFSNDKLLV